MPRGVSFSIPIGRERVERRFQELITFDYEQTGGSGISYIRGIGRFDQTDVDALFVRVARAADVAGAFCYFGDFEEIHE